MEPVSRTGIIVFRVLSLIVNCITSTFEKNPTKGGSPAATKKEKTKVFFFDFLISVRDIIEILLFLRGLARINSEIRVITYTPK